MTVSALAINFEPDLVEIVDWASNTDFNLQQVDCLVAIMLKILDGKCKMDPATQLAVRSVYLNAHRQRSHLFDTAIHDFIASCFSAPDPLSFKHVHELRVFAESAIHKSVMKGFKQWLWTNMPD